MFPIEIAPQTWSKLSQYIRHAIEKVGFLSRSHPPRCFIPLELNSLTSSSLGMASEGQNPPPPPWAEIIVAVRNKAEPSLLVTGLMLTKLKETTTNSVFMDPEAKNKVKRRFQHSLYVKFFRKSSLLIFSPGGGNSVKYLSLIFQMGISWSNVRHMRLCRGFCLRVLGPSMDLLYKLHLGILTLNLDLLSLPLLPYGSNSIIFLLTYGLVKLWKLLCLILISFLRLMITPLICPNQDLLGFM